MLFRILLTLLLIGAVAGGVLAIRHNQDSGRAKAMAGGPPPATVTDVWVERSEWSRRIEAVGDLRAIQDVAIASEVPGKVVEINFQSGVSVAEGDVLVRLDAAEDRAQLEALEADLGLARLENQRVVRLRGSPAYSQSLMDRTQSEVASLQAQVQQQRVRLQRKEIRAPFDGELGIRQISLGNIVAAGDPIVELKTLDPIYVDFTVPERHRSVVQSGQPLQISVAAWPEETFAGELTVVSPDVDVRSRTLRLRGQLANEDGRLQPGMFATVHLIQSGAEPVLTLPRTAISFFAYGESVFTITEEDGQLTVQRRAVKVGRTRNEQVEILSGLDGGQRVVHTGHLKLREGQKVIIGQAVALPAGVGDR